MARLADKRKKVEEISDEERLSARQPKTRRQRYVQIEANTFLLYTRSHISKPISALCRFLMISRCSYHKFEVQTLILGVSQHEYRQIRGYYPRSAER